jgi:hypothetical protein
VPVSPQNESAEAIKPAQNLDEIILDYLADGEEK